MSRGNRTAPRGRATTRPGGRTAEHTRRITDATLDLLLDGGLGAVTFQAVAERADVGRATMYRRWSTPAHLVVDAIRSVAADRIEIADTGTLLGDLTAVLGQIGEFIISPVGRAAVIAGLQIGPAELDDAFVQLVATMGTGCTDLRTRRCPRRDHRRRRCRGDLRRVSRCRLLPCAGDGQTHRRRVDQPNTRHDPRLETLSRPSNSSTPASANVTQRAAPLGGNARMSPYPGLWTWGCGRWGEPRRPLRDGSAGPLEATPRNPGPATHQIGLRVRGPGGRRAGTD